MSPFAPAEAWPQPSSLNAYEQSTNLVPRGRCRRVVGCANRQVLTRRCRCGHFTSRDVPRHQSTRGFAHRRPESEAFIESRFGQLKKRCARRRRTGVPIKSERDRQLRRSPPNPPPRSPLSGGTPRTSRSALNPGRRSVHSSEGRVRPSHSTRRSAHRRSRVSAGASASSRPAPDPTYATRCRAQTWRRATYTRTSIHKARADHRDVDRRLPTPSRPRPPDTRALPGRRSRR